MKRAVMAINNFVNIPVNDLISFALNVVDKMTGNPLYPNPTVQMSMITHQTDVLATAVTKANGGGIVETAIMHVAEKTLINSLKSNGRYINNLTYDNVVGIDSTGYTSSVAETAIATNPTQAIVEVVQTKNAGTAVINITGCKGAKSFTAILYPTDAPTPVFSGQGIMMGEAKGVMIITNTHSKMTVTDLASNTRYNVVAFGVNSAGISQLSNVVDVVTR